MSNLPSCSCQWNTVFTALCNIATCKPALRVLPLFFVFCWITVEVSSLHQSTYANEWAVEIDGDKKVADEIATAHGFINHGKILQDENYYLFSHPKLKKRSLEANEYHHSKLSSHKKIKWAEQQRIKRRVKRDYIYTSKTSPNDEKWKDMWYLLPKTNPSMRVTEAWEAGYTGKNVAVTILDDGIEKSHPDLAANYDPLASGDINGNDDDPSPRLNPTNENRHGTRCAGEVAAVGNNNVCAIGIAYNGKIGGVRMLDGQVTDAVEAASIGFHPEHVDIYSASWGPDDDGRTVDGPAKLARHAFINGVTSGRQGKGSIFVWASGNGGRHQDSCNCDGYTDSIYTLSISSTNQRGLKPWYSESCSSTLATTYSSGSSGDGQIVTTDLRHGCTTTHTGTSASAPLAAGICALALEANPSLTWRDMQHLVVRTARPDGLNAGDWVTNGVQRKVSHAFGYGLMDAYGMVTMAKNWTNVPPQRKCIKSVISENQTSRKVSSSSPLVVPVEVMACDDGDMVERLEHVQAELTLRNERRGDLLIYLTSPSGTRAQLLGSRRSDLSSQGFLKWAFMSTHTWDEDPRGRWSLEIRDQNQRAVYGTLSHFDLIMYGTKIEDWPKTEALPISSSTPKTSTTLTSTTLKSTPVTEKVSDSNAKPSGPLAPAARSDCVIQAADTGCLVCRNPLALDPKTRHCTKSCSDGSYRALEKVNVKGEKKPITKSPGSSEESSDAKQEGDFEDEERFYNGHVCRSCPAYCHRCFGPRLVDCVQCVSGATFRDSDGACVLTNSNKTPVNDSDRIRAWDIFLLCFAVVALAVIVFVLLFILCRLRRSPRCPCFSTSDVTYKYLPSGEGGLTRLYTDDFTAEDYQDEAPFSDSTSPTKVNPKNGLLPSNGYIHNNRTTLDVSPLLIDDDSNSAVHG